MLPNMAIKDRLGLFLKELSNEKTESRFVVHLHDSKIPYFIDVAHRMEMTSPRFSYIFTNLVSTKFWNTE